MNYSFYNILKSQKGFVTLLTFFLTKAVSSQSQLLSPDSLSYLLKKNTIETNVKKGNISFELTASILSKAKIIKDSGYYRLQSNLQSSYEAGINYIFTVNTKFFISTGFHILLGKRNFFSTISDSGLPGYSNGLYIEDKALWSSISIPLIIEKGFGSSKKNSILFKAGMNFRYSGFNTDERIQGSVFDSVTNTKAQIFNADLSGKNDYKPWVTFLTGISKRLVLDNHNILSLSFQTDFSPSYFLKGGYQITIPRKPITTGTYKINGTSLGLSVEYVFTGYNKKLVNPRKVIKSTDALAGKMQNAKLNRKEYLYKYVFKGNHSQVNIASLSTFKAQLKNQTGSHAVSSSPALGLLLSLKYHVNFNNEYSIITGPEAIILGRNFKTSFNKNDFSPPLIKDYEIKGISSYISDMILSLPILLERRWLYANSKYLFVDAGFRLNFSTGADFDAFSIYLQNTNNSYYNAGGVDASANNDAKPWVSIPLNAGHAWLLRNNNLLQLSICSNISFTKYVNGTYQIDVPNKPLTTGKYSSTGSYIGLSMNYVFTNANYRIRKAYEKKL